MITKNQKIAGYRTGLLMLAFLVGLSVQGQVYDIVVAKDGSGDYSSIQMAFDMGTFNSTGRTLIFVKNGEYKEKVKAHAIRENVSLIGESVDKVIISWDDYSGKTAGMSTAESYTFLAEGDDFYAENLTIENTSGDVGQAVAIRTIGDRQVFKNCRFLGFQDTYYAHQNRQYNLDCYIEGATDFIFGDATAVFDSCTINCVSGGSYITAPADTKLVSSNADGTFYHGLLFTACTLTADDDVPEKSYYLGRPWSAPGSSVYINCRLDSHIRDEGWAEWNDPGHLGTFAEYQSKDPSGALIDISGRVGWSTQLTSEEVEAYYNLDYFLKKEETAWDPKPVTEALAAPENLNADANVDTYELSWDEVSGAKGYTIIRNDATVAFSTVNSYKDTTADKSIDNVYKVKSVTVNGNLSASSNEAIMPATITGIGDLSEPAFEVALAGKKILVSERVNVKVYTFSGALVKTASHTRSVSLEGMYSGVYLIRLVNNDGNVVVKKVAFRE